MSKLKLTMACGPYDRTRALQTGKVQPDGIELTYLTIKPADGFARMLRYQEFDVSEMSISLYLASKILGKVPFTAIPVFTMRRFFHSEIVVNSDSGIRAPSDLNGKRFGVPEYGMSLALWIRGILLHEFGVDPSSMEWYVERSPGETVGDAIGLKLPLGAKIRQVPKDTDVMTMLDEGRIDAAYPLPRHWRTKTDRVKDVPEELGSKVMRLFSDPKAETIRFYSKTGLFPINHIIVIKDSLLKENPWVARNLYEAFEESKRISYEESANVAKESTNFVWLDSLWDEIRSVMGEDPFPYGIMRNEKILNEVITYSYEQSLSPRKAELSELFVRSTLNT